MKRRRPHIFSSKQISQILEASWALKPTDSLKPFTYTTLLALLVTTGLRISESLTLQIDDVTDTGLVIRKTKFRKSRIVPLHSSVKQALNRYLTIRKKVAGSDSTVFVGLKGNRLPYSTVFSTFLALTRRIGIRPEIGLPGPTIHDMRHTFAVRSLEQCPSDRDKIHRHMHALSTYLGHTHISDTYWYLHATPTLLIDIAIRVEDLITGSVS